MANPSNNKQSGNSRRSGGASGSRSGSDVSMSSFDDQSGSSASGSMGSDSSSVSGSTGSDSSRSASGSTASDEQRDQNQPKSVGTVIAENLARESQEKIDRALGQFNGYFTQTTSYISSNPREATAIAVAAGMVAWVLLGTKPGRRIFEMGAAMVIPEATKWVQNNFANLTSGSGQNQSATH